MAIGCGCYAVHGNDNHVIASGALAPRGNLD